MLIMSHRPRKTSSEQWYAVVDPYCWQIWVNDIIIQIIIHIIIHIYIYTYFTYTYSYTHIIIHIIHVMNNMSPQKKEAKDTPDFRWLSSSPGREVSSASQGMAWWRWIDHDVCVMFFPPKKRCLEIRIMDEFDIVWSFERIPRSKRISKR